MTASTVSVHKMVATMPLTGSHSASTHGGTVVTSPMTPPGSKRANATCTIHVTTSMMRFAPETNLALSALLVFGSAGGSIAELVTEAATWYSSAYAQCHAR